MSESTDDEVRDRRPPPARRDAALSPARAEAHAREGPVRASPTDRWTTARRPRRPIDRASPRDPTISSLTAPRPPPPAT
jgi:hypothetical protein